MKNAKVILALLLCVLMVVGMVACGDKPAETTAPETTKEVAETTTTHGTTTGKPPVTSTAPVTTAEDGPHTTHTWSAAPTFTPFAEKAADGSIGYAAITCTVPGCKAIKDNKYNPVYIALDFDQLPDMSKPLSADVAGIEGNSNFAGYPDEQKAQYDVFLRYIDAAQNVAPYTGFKPGDESITSVAGAPGAIIDGALSTTKAQLYVVDQLSLLSVESPIREFYTEFDMIVGTTPQTGACFSSRPITKIPNYYPIIMTVGKGTGANEGKMELRWNDGKVTKFDDCTPIDVFVDPTEKVHVIYHITEDDYTVTLNGKQVFAGKMPARKSTADTEFMIRFTGGSSAGRSFDNYLIYGPAVEGLTCDACGGLCIGTEIPATCTAGGKIVSTCLECGKKIDTALEALGHDFGVFLNPDDVVFPTDGSAPYINRVCLRCGEKVKETEGAIRHVHYLVKREAAEATCATLGYSECYECLSCGKFFTDVMGKVEIEADLVVIPKDPAKHVGDPVVLNQKAATCFEPGNEGDVCCSACGAVITPGAEIPMIDHKISAAWTRDEENHWKTCTVYGCGAIIGSKEAHDYVWVTDKFATEFASGLQHEQCTICGGVRNEGTVIPQLNHNHNLFHTAGSTPTCMSTGNLEYWYCNSCKNYYGDAEATILLKDGPELPKDYTNHVGQTQLANSRAVTCWKPGYTGDAVCQACGRVAVPGSEIKQLPHNFDTAETYVKFKTKAADGAIGDLGIRCLNEGCPCFKDGKYKNVYVSLDFDVSTVDTSAALPTDLAGIEGTSTWKGYSADQKTWFDKYLRYMEAAENVHAYNGLKPPATTYSAAGAPGKIEAGKLEVPKGQLYSVDELALLSKESKITDFYCEFDMVFGAGTCNFGFSARKTTGDPSVWMAGMCVEKVTGGEHDGEVDVRCWTGGEGKFANLTNNGYFSATQTYHVVMHITGNSYTVKVGDTNLGTFTFSRQAATGTGTIYEFLFRWASTSRADRSYDNFIIYTANTQAN